MESVLIAVAVVVLTAVASAQMFRLVKGMQATADEQNGSFPASCRGEDPFPRRWNFNGGHLAISESTLSWSPHLRPEKVWTMERGSFVIDHLRSPKPSEIWSIGPQCRVVVATAEGKNVELALLPDGLRALLTAFGREDLLD